MVKAMVIGPKGVSKEMGLDELINMLMGPGTNPKAEGPLTHFLRYDDKGPDKPMYHRIRTPEERKRADGSFTAPSTLTDIIGLATPLTQDEAEGAAKIIAREGACECDDPECFGRYTKVVAMPIPEGWTAVTPIIVDPATPVQ